MLKLFYSPGSCALASHIALIDAGADYEAVRIDFAKQEQQTPDYLAINPKGRVPSLITEKGVVTETPAVLAYIAQRFPQAKLAPLDDLFAFARVQEFNSYLCATCHVAHAHGRRGMRWVDASETDAIAAMKSKLPIAMMQCFELIERGMLKGPWVMGEDYTICDPYLFTIARWLEGDGVDPGKLPRVADHMRRMAERPSAQQALAEQNRALAPAA
jgi:glutathione S-transferase